MTQTITRALSLRGAALAVLEDRSPEVLIAGPAARRGYHGSQLTSELMSVRLLGMQMIQHGDNVVIGDHVIDTWSNESLLITDVRYRESRGWECWSQRPDGSMGPTFYPHPDRMPDSDPWIYSGTPLA